MNVKFKIKNSKLFAPSSLFLTPYFIILSFLFSSCNHKELCMHHEHAVRLRVQFDWRYAPEINELDNKPFMSVYFYPEEGGDPIKINMSGLTGSEIEIPAGSYYIISHPAEQEVLRASSAQSATDHLLHTRSSDSSEVLFGSSAAPSDLILEPETTWVAAAKNVYILETGIKYECIPFYEGMDTDLGPVETTEEVITLYPADPMCYYTLEVIDPRFNFTPAAFAGSLSGMSQALYPANGEPHRSLCTIPFSCQMVDGSLWASFVTFGHHTALEDPHELMLYVLSDDNKLFSVSTKTHPNFDLTQQVHSAQDRHHVHLIVDFVEINSPDPPNTSSEGGLSGETEEWTEISKDISI